jgi:hypothetical protein
MHHYMDGNGGIGTTDVEVDSPVLSILKIPVPIDTRGTPLNISCSFLSTVSSF